MTQTIDALNIHEVLIRAGETDEAFAFAKTLAEAKGAPESAREMSSLKAWRRTDASSGGFSTRTHKANTWSVTTYFTQVHPRLGYMVRIKRSWDSALGSDARTQGEMDALEKNWRIYARAYVQKYGHMPSRDHAALEKKLKERTPYYRVSLERTDDAPKYAQYASTSGNFYVTTLADEEFAGSQNTDANTRRALKMAERMAALAAQDAAKSGAFDDLREEKAHGLHESRRDPKTLAARMARDIQTGKASQTTIQSFWRILARAQQAEARAAALHTAHGERIQRALTLMLSAALMKTTICTRNAGIRFHVHTLGARDALPPHLKGILSPKHSSGISVNFHDNTGTRVAHATLVVNTQDTKTGKPPTITFLFKDTTGRYPRAAEWTLPDATPEAFAKAIATHKQHISKIIHDAAFSWAKSLPTTITSPICESTTPTREQLDRFERSATLNDVQPALTYWKTLKRQGQARKKVHQDMDRHEDAISRLMGAFLSRVGGQMLAPHREAMEREQRALMELETEYLGTDGVEMRVYTPRGYDIGERPPSVRLHINTWPARWGQGLPELVLGVEWNAGNEFDSWQIPLPLIHPRVVGEALKKKGSEMARFWEGKWRKDLRQLSQG
jgi:hypothetical protein